MPIGAPAVPFGHPDNPLGTRWIAWFDEGGKTSYGIHGTADGNTVGGRVSRGCIRLTNRDVETWMDGAGGKVVKVISSLLEYLPPQHTYKIIFMEREMSEVLASQQKMLANRHEASTVADEELRQQFHDHLKTVKAWLVRQPNIEVLYINFETILADPESFCAGVADFIGLPLNVENMLSVPNKNLYRNRS
jgi:hypothetical protein